MEINKFEGHYDEWRKKRILKMENIFSIDFFQNKKILEVGCGYGQIGQHFRNIGSFVEFTEGREEHISYIKKYNPDSLVHNIDHDKEWNLNKKYDIVIHFGLLYHLTNWKQDLLCTFKHTDLIILESEILDSLKDDNQYFARDGGGYDQALPTTNFAIRPTAKLVENFILENDFNFVRYDDKDLDTPLHTYSWKLKGIHDKNGGYIGYGPTRRFWVIKKNA